LSHIAFIEAVDTHESYGFFGKVVTREDVSHLVDAVDITNAGLQLLADLGDPQGKVYSLRYVEEVPAA
jgi:hypothetical protein